MGVIGLKRLLLLIPVQNISLIRIRLTDVDDVGAVGQNYGLERFFS